MFSENAAQSEALSMRNGNQVAGLMDIAKLLKFIGKSMPESDMKALAAQTQKFPRESYEEQKLFIDPMGRLMNDRGATYVGRDIPAYGSLKQLVEEGQTLQDYLQGTEAADLFGPELSRFRFGIAPLPSNFEAGVTPPQGFVLPDTGKYRHLQDGFMAISSSMPKEKIGSLFEHEMQHVYQNALGMPRGTTFDEVSDNDFFDYLQSINSLTPARRKRIDDFAANAGTPRSHVRYASATGEAEARAAAKRYMDQQNGLLARIPKPSDYTQNDFGANIKPSMMYDIPQDTAEGYRNYRANLFRNAER